MSISYRNMLAFIRVAESATFAEAAEKLHLTQPALSSAIKKMEEQLGGKLFSRSTRRVTLTPEGHTLLPTARRLVNEWDETYHDMQNLFAMVSCIETPIWTLQICWNRLSALRNIQIFSLQVK